MASTSGKSTSCPGGPPAIRIPPSSDCLLLVVLAVTGGVRAPAPGTGESRTEEDDSVRGGRGPRPDIVMEGVDRCEVLGALDPFTEVAVASLPSSAGPAASDSSAIEELCMVPLPVDDVGGVNIRDAGWLCTASSSRCSFIRATDSPSTPSTTTECIL